MHTYDIRGVSVEFPFEAYDCQIVYMEKVIQALQNGSRALLESPTGTGKTLCLLCATLAWRENLSVNRRRISSQDDVGESESQAECCDRPKIIYTSRTHSQLKQVIRELKMTNYRPKMTVLGSREQLCIHTDAQVHHGRARDYACHSLRKKHACSHYTRVSDFSKQQSFGKDPFDIEDLGRFGKINGMCPYYVSRDLHKKADIIFAPYNYVIDKKKRQSLTGISWNETILIFDEAHNVPSMCADASSIDFHSHDLTTCISEVKHCIHLASNKVPLEKSVEKECDQYGYIKAVLLKLKVEMNEVVLDSEELGFTADGLYIYEFLSKMGLTFDTFKTINDNLDNAVLLLQENRFAHETEGTICRLELFRDNLEIIFGIGKKDRAEFYRFHVKESKQKDSDGNISTSRTLSWWCFNPGLTMQEFSKLGVRSIILTSGTLSPLNSFAAELNLDFPIRLENPHVVSSNQVWVGVVPNGPSGGLLNSSFNNRDSLEYKQELGNAIVNFSRIVPDGLLVFFPSYYLMDQCIKCWKKMGHVNATQQSTIWERICRNKKPVIEPKQSAQFAQAINDYEAKLQKTSSTGVIFFAVCRGKVSEGLDFADKAGRAVVITGVPFAMRNDPKVRLRREYLDKQAISQKKHKHCQVLTGEEWYLQEATRAVNQAVGRVIRHRNDYGAIIFCDERFTQTNKQNQMSYWIRPYVKCYSVFGGVTSTLSRFFRDNGACVAERQNQAKCLITGTINKINVRLNNDKESASIIVNHQDYVSANDFSKKTLQSDFSSTSCSMSFDLTEIIPANCSNISNLQSQPIAPKKSKNILGPQKRLQTVDEKRKTSCRNLDSQDIDLTDDSLIKFRSRFSDVISPHLRKKTKFLKTSENKTTLDYFSHIDFRNISRESSFDNQSEKKKTLQSEAKFVDYDKTKHHPHIRAAVVNYGDDVASLRASFELQPQIQDSCQSLPSGSKEGGNIFLSKVEEKVSVSEYKEFLRLMKALKSKTMDYVHVFKSIVKLFHGPERFSLSESFKEFVPVKHRLFYDKLLRESERENDK